MGAASHSAVPYCGAGDGNHRLSAQRVLPTEHLASAHWAREGCGGGKAFSVEPGERGQGHAEGRHCALCAHMAGARLLPSVTLCVRV